MIKFDEDIKTICAKYVGADGKLIIDDSLPENIKQSFEFFNSRNINIMELNIDDSDINNNYDEPDDSFLDNEFEENDNYYDDEVEELVENFSLENSNVDLDDLNDFF